MGFKGYILSKIFVRNMANQLNMFLFCSTIRIKNANCLQLFQQIFSCPIIRLVVKSLGESVQQRQVSARYFDSALEMVFSVAADSFS